MTTPISDLVKHEWKPCSTCHGFSTKQDMKMCVGCNNYGVEPVLVENIVIKHIFPLEHSEYQLQLGKVFSIPCDMSRDWDIKQHKERHKCDGSLKFLPIRQERENMWVVRA